MDFSERLESYSKRVATIKDTIVTEEATKTSLIMPFFQILGYDVFNPNEFVPEFTADVGIKKGEKVDFAILENNSPLILIEAKSVNEDLKRHDSQLFRYFGTSNAKFAILTNGLIYRFFTDLDDSNKMDEDPFYELDILNIKDSDLIELRKFHKENFDMSKIMDTATELKYSSMIKSIMNSELENPSDEFSKYLLTNIYSGVKTQNVIDKFKPIIKKSLNRFINEIIGDKLKQVVNNNSSNHEDDLSDEEVSTIIENEHESIENRIITTEDELESFALIKFILKDNMDINRLYYKDTISYFGILLDNNVRKWICRLVLTDNVRYILIPNEKNERERHDFENLHDLANYKDLILKRISVLDETKENQ